MAEPKVLTRGDLDAASVPTLHPYGMALLSTCHDDAPLQVYYRDGVVTTICHSCRTVVARIVVASVDLRVH